MGNEQIKAGSLLSYLQMAINILIGLLYTPLMIKLLGQNEYGLYNTVASTISMLSILNLGFGSGYIRYYAQYKVMNDEEAIRKLNGLFIIIFGVSALIAMFCGAYLSTHLGLIFNEGLTAEEYEKAKILMWLLTLNLSISFPMSVFINIISAHEQFIFLKLAGMGKTVLSPLLTIPLLLLGYGSIGVVTVTVIVSIIVDCMYVYHVISILNQRFKVRGFEAGIFSQLFSYTIFIAINIVIDQINWNIDKVILARYLGTATVAVYSVGAVLQTYYNMFSTAISGVFTPRIHKIVNDIELTVGQRHSLLTNLFMRVGRIQFMVLTLICSGFVLFGQSFIYLWAGKGYEESYSVALLLMIPVTVPLIQNLGIEIQRAENKHQFRSIAYLIMAVANLIMTFNLCQILGATGAAIGTAISLVVANGVVMNIYYHKQCGIDVIVFWKSIGHVLLGILPAIIIGCVIRHFVFAHTWLQLIGLLLLYTTIYLVFAWTFSMNTVERNLISVPLRKLVQNR